MSKLEKLLERIRNNPKTVRFEELDKIITGAGYERTQPRGGSSHFIYKRENQPPIVIPRHLPYVKEFYVKIALEKLGI